MFTSSQHVGESSVPGCQVNMDIEIFEAIREMLSRLLKFRWKRTTRIGQGNKWMVETSRRDDFAE